MSKANGPDDRRPRVLLAHEDQPFRTALIQQLEERGYQVTGVDNETDALELVRNLSPEVMILNREMRGMNGEEALKAISRSRPEVPVILLTGPAGGAAAGAPGRPGVFASIYKPCGLEELVAKLEAARAVRQRSSAPPAAAAVWKRLQHWLHRAVSGIRDRTRDRA